MPDTVRILIVDDDAEMRALLVDPEGNLARIDDFPMIDRPRVCRRCNFRRLCFPRAEPFPELAAAGRGEPLPPA